MELSKIIDTFETYQWYYLEMHILFHPFTRQRIFHVVMEALNPNGSSPKRHGPSRGVDLVRMSNALSQNELWYVSNVSMIFDCSMLLYYSFWMFMGFILHIYIIFGTNLLTGGPAQNCCFFSYFRVSTKRNIKRSPNGMKPSGTWFSHRTWSRRLGLLPPIYTYVPPNDQVRSLNPNSTAVTFCIHEIPS